ncbi:MAG TPA: protein kinase [Isosphaeraceae bacterium]|nr:protein kinase [Isosphaeraceae bacterium]
MAENTDPATGDLDDGTGTWHQPARSEPTLPPDDMTRRKAPDLGSVDGTPAPPRDTVAGTDPTPPPFATSGGKDSPDSDEATPKPGTEGSDEWNLLPAPTIGKGHVVFGKYLLEEKIGEGGMGQVWRVENIPLDREVALKLIRPEYAQNKNGWLRFEREARLMAKIEHPNVVAVYALGRAQSLGYIEMEFVPGRSLEKYLKERKGAPVSLEWTAQLLDQLCSVLYKAHGHIDKKSGKVKPIIHRDLKPSNLILVEGLPAGQNLKVLDFGIAKMVMDEGSPELTGQGDVVGTPYYMSPEQIRGGVSKGGRGEIDGRSDLYSVGVLLYQLLTESLPFTGRNNMEVLLAHLHHKPLPMKEANPDVHVPAQVEQLVMSCLEKDPDLRPQSARELADRFRAAIA